MTWRCSQVSILAAQGQPGELGARTEMTAVVNHHRIRHAHMVNINRQIMLEGMRADFCAVDELSQRLVEHARQVDRITCKTPQRHRIRSRAVTKTQVAQDQRASLLVTNGATFPAAKFSLRR